MEKKTKSTEENLATKIIFQNQPLLSEHEVDQKFNERRLALVPHVEKFIKEHELFQGKEVSVQFSEKGVSSLVSIIETKTEKFVLKIALGLHYTGGEADFLKVWEEVGVKVPRVLESGRIHGHEYVLMQYVNASMLNKAYSDEKMREMGIYEEMGRTLRIMHGPKAKGFGKFLDGKAEFEKFEDWINEPSINKRIEYIKDNNILDDAESLMAKVKKILIKALNNSDESIYCHFDFGTHNIFATKPITVFDPSPRFNNFYIDVGRSAQSFISKGYISSLDQFIEGYFNGKPYDNNVLTASIIFNILYKIPYVHKTKRFDNIENYKNYIANNPLS